MYNICELCQLIEFAGSTSSTTGNILKDKM